jgi:hypothetical protein
MPVQNAVNSSDSVTADLKMPAPGDKGYDQWRMTGKLPEFQEEEAEEVKPEVKQDQVQEQEPSLEEEDSASSASVIADSEPARPQKGKKSGEARKTELNAEIRELTRKAAELRRSAAQPSVTPEPRPEAEPEKKPTAAKGRTEPQLDDKDDKGQPKYKTWQEFQNDLRKWDREEIRREALAEVDTRMTKQQRDQQLSAAQQAVDDVWAAKVEQARQKYPDFDTVAKNVLTAKDRNGKEFFLPRGSAIDEFLLESPYGPDVFYYIAGHVNDSQVQDIFELGQDGKRFKMTGVQQVLALSEIASKFSAPPKPAPKPSATLQSKAPRPVNQVSGHSPANLDEEEKAVKDGEFDAFKNAANEKDPRLLAVRQRRRRA